MANNSPQAVVDIQRATTSQSVPDDKDFEQWIMAAMADNTKYSLAIRIVDEPEARRHNNKFRKRDDATNILSFPAELPPGLPADIAQSQLGDLLICAPVVVRESLQQGKPEYDHWAHLTVHGILHLRGYDHQEDADAFVMEALETEILAKLGIADPYRSC